MITGISFVGIVVNDIEEARSLYADTLGLEPWEHGKDGFIHPKSTLGVPVELDQRI